MVKKIKLLNIVILSILIANPLVTIAKQKAMFPDNSTMRPVSKDSVPNISGNVNHTTTDGNTIDSNSSTDSNVLVSNTTDNQNQISENPNSTDQKKSSDLYSIFALLGFMVLISIVFIARRGKNK